MNRDIQFTKNVLRRPNEYPPLSEPRDRGYQRLSLFQLARAMGLNIGSQVRRISPFKHRGYTTPQVGAVEVLADGRRLLPIPHGVARALKARG